MPGPTNSPAGQEAVVERDGLGLRALRSRLALSRPETLRATRSLGRAAQLAALLVVGVSTLPAPYGPTRNLVSEVVAFCIAVMTVALWWATDLVPVCRARLKGVLPLATGAMATSCGLAALTNSGGPFSLLASMAIIWAASTLSFVVAGTIAVFATIAVATVAAVYASGAWDVLGYPMIILFSFVFGRLVSSFRLQAEQSAALLANAEQLHMEQNRAATLDERNRIAREIHDLLAHSLGALGVQIQAAQAVLTDQGDIDKAVELLGQARRLASDGLHETRRALYALRDDTPPLPEALAELTSGHQRRYQAPVNFEVTGTPRSLSADASLALTRTAQESLVNTAKYAPRQPVDMRLDYHQGHTTLTVVNPMCHDLARHDTLLGGALPGHLETVNGGYGLGGMRERLLLIEGSLQAGPEQGTWVVSAQVPQ